MLADPQRIQFFADPVRQGTVGDNGDLIFQRVTAFAGKGVFFERQPAQVIVSRVHPLITGSPRTDLGEARDGNTSVQRVLPGNQLTLARHAFGEHHPVVGTIMDPPENIFQLLTVCFMGNAFFTGKSSPGLSELDGILPEQKTGVSILDFSQNCPEIPVDNPPIKC